MIKEKMLWFAILVAFCLYGCVTDVPIDIEDTQQIVVNCILTTDSIQKLSLTYSEEVGDYTFAEVKSAQVELFENDTLAGCFSKVSFGNWELNYCPVKGSDYRLLITLDDGTVVSATTHMPVDNVVIPVSDEHTLHRFSQLSASYPMWMFSLGHSPGVAETVYEYPTDEFSLKNCYTNHPLIDDFNQEEEGIDDSLFSYFYYGRCRNLDNSDSLTLDFCCKGSSEFFFFRTVSFEYDQYLKSSVQKMKIREVEEDPLIWFDESVVYTNVENGLGIFGAFSDHYFYYFWLHLYSEIINGECILY